MHTGLDERLLGVLADGQFHSGVELARALGVSRGTVWQHIGKLQDRKLDVFAVRGKGYRLGSSVELLDQQKIADQLTGFARRAVTNIEIKTAIESTNAYLLDAPRPLPGRFVACLAEYQTQGRGRRGRVWLSPFGAGLCLSLACRFDARNAQFSTLSLSIGVAVVRALRTLNITGVELKWPNDLVAWDRKLGGILVQIRGEASGPTHIIIGIGLNVTATPDVDDDGRAMAPVCVKDFVTPTPGRNALAAAIISQITTAVDVFGREGFAPFVADWRRVDYLAGKAVRVDGDVLSVSGVALGVTDDGALQVETGGRVREFVGGEVSVRPQATEGGG